MSQQTDLLPALNDPLNLGTGVAAVPGSANPTGEVDSTGTPYPDNTDAYLNNLNAQPDNSGPNIEGDINSAGVAIATGAEKAASEVGQIAGGAVKGATSNLPTPVLVVGGVILTIALLGAVGYAWRAFR